MSSFGVFVHVFGWLGILFNIWPYAQYSKQLRARTANGGMGPWCMACDYPLTGIPRQECPECGNDLTRIDSVVVNPTRLGKLYRGHTISFAVLVAMQLVVTFMMLTFIVHIPIAIILVMVSLVWAIIAGICVVLVRRAMREVRGHRIDPDVPINERRGCLAVDEG